MKPLEVSLEKNSSGAAMAWAFAIPGASGQGKTQHEAIEDLIRVVNWSYDWFEKKEILTDKFSDETKIIETLEVEGYFETGDTIGLFEYDKAPLTDHEIVFTHDILLLTRKDVVESANAVFEHCEEKEKEYTNWILMHLAKAEWYYASRIINSSAYLTRPVYPDEPFQAMEEAREMLLYSHPPFVRCMSPREQVFEIDGEKWTAKKSLRRAMWHDFYHLRQLQGFLSKTE